MADQFDMASEIEDNQRAAAITAARLVKPAMKPCGICYNCEEPLPPADLFCDDHCRDDWQLRNPSK